MQPDTKTIKTRGYQFETLIWGDGGPKVLLLHGFPESPHIFDSLAIRLADSGYQVFAPFLPGYGATPPLNPDTGITFLDELAHAFAAFADCITRDKEKVILVGHDWGAAAAYVTAGYHSGRFSKLIALSVPPLPAFLRSFLRHPSQLFRSRYMLFFQLPGIAERVIRRNDYRYLRLLCKSWAGSCETSEVYFSGDQAAFNAIPDYRYPLGYYRGLMPFFSGSVKAWRKSMRLAFRKIDVQTTIMVGERDGCIAPAVYHGFENQFRNGVTLDIVKNTGHFLPLDAPDAVLRKIVQRESRE